MKRSLSKRVATLVFLSSMGIVGKSAVSMPVYAQQNSVVKAEVQNVNETEEKDGLYEVSVKTLQEKNDSPSMAGGYLEKVNYEIKDGKKFLIFSLDSIDWMKNISVTVDGKEIQPTPTDVAKKGTNDGKGEQKGKIKFEVTSLDSKVMLHMNVVPMGNARVAFRVIPEKNTVKLIKEYIKEVPNTAPVLKVGETIETEEGKAIDLMQGVSATDKEDGDLTNNIKVEVGKLDVKNPTEGTYEVTYSVEDKAGEKVTVTRKVIIKKAQVKPIEIKEKDGLYEVSVKTLKEKEDSASMAGGYLEKVNYEVKDGKKFFIFSLDSIDWMKNISVTVDGKEITPNPTDVVKKGTNDGKGEEKGKIKFEIESLDSKVMLHMNVVPMGNVRVAFRVVPEKNAVKLIKAYKKEVLNTAPVLKVGETIETEAGKAIDLMQGVTATDKEDGDLTNKIKVEAGKLDAKNPTEGTYEVTYSVTDKAGETVTATREVVVNKINATKPEQKIKNAIADGLYSVRFTAYKLEDENETSMLNNFFDKKAKLEVKDGKLTLTMLAICFADGIYDFRIESNNEFPESIAKGYGKLDSKGNHIYKTFEINLSDIDSPHEGCVLVGPMGALKSDIGHFDKYRKVKFSFDKDNLKEWNGFDEDHKVVDDDKNFNKALLSANLDKDGDKVVTNEELALAEGKVDLARKEIKDISRLKFLGKNVTELNLTGNEIKELPEGVFNNLTKLKKLYINGNQIKKLPKGIFDKLTELTELELGMNEIEELPKGIFDKLPKLESLSLYKNSLKNIDSNVFDKLNNLQYVSFEGNKLKEIPQGVFNLCNLKTLIVKENEITTIPKELSNLENLKWLDLGSNYIEEIPMEVYQKLNKLSTFDIKDNKLKEIPKNIFEIFPENKWLNCSFNNLKEMPDIPKNLVGKVYFQGYPQKNVLNLKLSAENGKITWNQDISSVDLIVWYKLANAFNTKKIPQNIDEYKELLGNKTSLEFLKEKLAEPKIITQIQKKDVNGEYVTIKEIINVNEIDHSDVLNDSNMKNGDKYRIIKKVYENSFGSDLYICTDVAYAIANTEPKPTEGKPVEPKPEQKEKITKQISVVVLKENSNEPSMAGDYLNKNVTYTEKDGKKFFTITLTRIDWMKNVAVSVDGSSVSYDKKQSGTSADLTFEVSSENSQVTLHMNVVPMSNARVAFRLVNANLVKPEEKPIDPKPEDKLEEKPTEPKTEKDLQNGIYKVEHSIVTSDPEEAKEINKYLKLNSEVKVEDKKIFVILKLNNEKYADDLQVFVDGKPVKMEKSINLKAKKFLATLESSNLSIEVPVKSNDSNNTEIKFEVPSLDSKIEVKTHISEMNKDVKFGVKLQEDTLKLISEKPVDKPVVDKENNCLYIINVKALKENNDELSMAGGYIEKVNYEIKDGKKYLIISLDSIDWMKNISATVDGKEIELKPIDIVQKESNDGKGKKKGKVKFEIDSLDSKIMLHMNVEPMGNSRVAFRVIADKNSLKEIKEEVKPGTQTTKPEDNSDTTKPVKPNNKPSSKSETKISSNLDKNNSKTNEDKDDKLVKINSVVSSEDSEDTQKDIENKKIGKSLPKTGSTFNFGLLGSLGVALSGLGISLKKKHVKENVKEDE